MFNKHKRLFGSCHSVRRRASSTKSVVTLLICLFGSTAIASAQVINTVAGDGSDFYNGHFAVDASGNIFIADGNNHRVRRIDAGTGMITTVAGTGVPGFSGDGGSATAALLNFPYGVDLDVHGNILIADGQNNRIRRVDATTGIINTVAGNGSTDFSGDGGPATAAGLNYPVVATSDASGNLFIADAYHHSRAPYMGCQ